MSVDMDRIKDVLQEGAARRHAEAGTNPDNLLVVAGEKMDITKENEFVPETMPKYVTDQGKVLDLDTGEYVELPNTMTIDNRVLKISDFGMDGAGGVVELYEQYLEAFQQKQKTLFYVMDGSVQIPNYLKCDDAKKLLVTKLQPSGDYLTYVDWANPHTTFEMWMEWSRATVRWRIEHDLENRYVNEMDIQKRSYMEEARAFMQTTLIAIEKYLALPERARLQGV